MKRKKYLSYNRSRRRKNFYKRNWFWKFILLSLSLGGLCWLIFKTSYFEIDEVKITGEKQLATTIQNIVGENLNFFLTSTSRLSQKIQKSFPEIESIKIQKEFPNKIVITILEKKPIGLVCYQKNPENCFLLASDGIIFAKADKEKNLPEFFIVNLSKIKIGDSVIERKTVKNLVFLEEKLKEIKVFISEVYILPYELEIKTKNGFTLFFLRNDSFKSQIEVLLDAFQTAISESEKKNLKYIDLRGIQENGRGEIYFK